MRLSKIVKHNFESWVGKQFGTKINDAIFQESSQGRSEKRDFDNRMSGADTNGDTVTDVSFEFDALGHRVKKGALSMPQFGRYRYRRITALLRREGWQVNHKRTRSRRFTDSQTAGPQTL